MLENPYKYVGPLDPVSDRLVCIPRQEQLETVINGVINNDDFWAVLGPRQIGKTTFLRQIEKNYPDAHYIYFNFEISLDTTDSFYQWIIKQFVETIPHESAPEQKKDTKKYTPEFSFLTFLEKFRPKQRDKKIILLFDEIEKIPSVSSFLHLWRKLYHDRYHKEQLNQYGVVMTGSVILLNLTVGSSSPFNISQAMYLNDLSAEDSRKLIEKPFERLGISIDEKAKKKLISYLGGHPQILQQSCYLLVNQARDKGEIIEEKNISEVFNHLLITNSVIDTLMQDIKTNHELKNLLLDILTGKKKKYFLYKEFSIGGAGPIIEDGNSFFKIRNRIFENYLKDFLKGGNELPLDEKIEPSKEHITSPILPNNMNKSQPVENKKKPMVFISYSHKDGIWREKLSTHLGVLEHQGIVVTWHDQDIKPGEDWFRILKEKINIADIALFLISAGSLTSEFILKEEVPEFLKRKEKDGLIIFPVIVRHCSWKQVDWLRSMEIRPKDGKPIEKRRTTAKQNEVLSEIVNEIAELLKVDQKDKII